MITSTATKTENLTDLSILGVPESHFGKKPGVYGYPKKFSPEALPVWKEMLCSKEFKKKTNNLNLDMSWHIAIQDFLELCETRGVFPFVNSTDISRNEYISDFIRRSRIELVKYFNEIKLFEKVKVKKAYRKYTRKDGGLIVSSWAELFPVHDPNFESWLTQTPLPRFLKTVNNRWTKQLRPNLQIWVRIINKSRITIGFNIQTAGVISIPGNKSPSRKEVDDYIDDLIFLPIIRSHRFDNLKTRLF